MVQERKRREEAERALKEPLLTLTLTPTLTPTPLTSYFQHILLHPLCLFYLISTLTLEDSLHSWVETQTGGPNNEARSDASQGELSDWEAEPGDRGTGGQGGGGTGRPNRDPSPNSKLLHQFT